MATQADAYQRPDGVWVWKSNDRVPFEDMLQTWNLSPEIMAKCNEARNKQASAALAEYRARRAKMTTEEKAEEQMMARAAVGSGVEMVNVLTGEKFTT
jgi:hypothetical protein